MNLRALLLGAVACGYFLFFLVAVAALAWHWENNLKAPVQPIDFPHTTHAGELGMECTFCHRGAESGKNAGAPSLERCAGCHRSIASDRPAIRALLKRIETNQPLAWNRVYAVPDFVYFSHRPHLGAGLSCEACHGALSSMERVEQVSSLSMGWCVTCHRANEASMDCATCHK